MAAIIADAYRERFDITRTLGEGGMGVVYEAFDRVRNEAVALKTILKADAESIYRLKREFRALANLEHPNLVRLYDLFVEADCCFFTMELVTGVDLATYVATRDPGTRLARETSSLDEVALRDAMSGLLRGLDALHGASLLHRDLKPSNVMVTSQGRVVVLDFGMVVDSHAAVQQTMQGAVSGTIAYMAPEQARGESDLTTACDLYAVGVILFQLLTGRLPFEGPPFRIMLMKQNEDPPKASSLAAGLPEDLDELASALMSRDSASRPRLSDVIAALGISQATRTASSSSSTSGAQRLVGRDAETAELESAYRRSHEGRPTLALVRGRSGIGKSALLQSFARLAEASGAIVLSSRCYESESVPFKGLDGIVDSLSRVLAMTAPDELGHLLPPNLRDLASLFPVLRRIRPIATAHARRDLSEQSVQRTRLQGFACLRELLRRLGEKAPLLLVLDDVQWADDDSARGLVDLVRGENPPTMMLLLGARPSDEAPVVRELFGDDASETVHSLSRTVVELGPLGLAAMRAIAERELGTDSALIEIVARDAGGVPFAAGELARFLREGELDPRSLEAGAPIDAIVRRRVAMLDEPARSVLEMVAVAGEPTSANHVLRALSLPEGDRSPIDALRGRAFVRSVVSASGAALDTAHDRIRESVLEAIDPATRANLHHRLALVLESLETPPHDRLARHFAAAGERNLGRLHALAAAAQASGELAFLRTAELFALALEMSDDDGRTALLAPYAEALTAAGRYEEAALVWLEASARTSGSTAREHKQRAAECWLYAGHIDNGLRLLDVLASEVGIRIPEHRWAVIWELVKCQIRLAFKGFRLRGRASTDTRSADLDRLRTLGAIAVQYTPLDPFRGAVPSIRYLLAALELGSEDELETALGLEAMMRANLGWRRGADRVLQMLDAIASRNSKGAGRAWASMARAVLALNAGDRRSGCAHADDAVDAIAAVAMAPAWLRSFGHYVEGYLSSYEMSVPSFQRMLTFVEEREERSGVCAELRLRAFAVQHHDMLTGRPENVLAFVEDARWASATARDVVSRTTAEWCAVHAHLYLGQPREAYVLAEKVRTGYVRQGVWWYAQARGGCLWFQASSALAIGDLRLARACLPAFGSARGDVARMMRTLLASIAAFADGRPNQVVRELTGLRELAARQHFPRFEALACWALGRIDPGPVGDEPRARYLEMVEGSGIVDPDLFFWALFPIGERPPREGSRRSSWSASAPAPAPTEDAPTTRARSPAA